jgi:hypothetical protein
VSLGNRGQTTLSVTGSSPFAVTATATDFRAWARFEGSLVMLCAPSATPGATLSRYVLVATSVAAGGVQPVQVTTVSSLVNKTLYAFAHCSYVGPGGLQGQDSAHDSQTVRLTFDAAGNATRSDAPPGQGAYFDQASLSTMLSGTIVNGLGVTTYSAPVGGVERVFLIERTFYDEIGQTEGSLTLWLEE